MSGWGAAASAAMQMGQIYAEGQIRAKKMGAEAYSTASKFYANRLRSTMIQDAATKNMAVARQDKILSVQRIIAAEQEAIENAKVSAAAAGVEGGSVEDVKQIANSNAGFRIQDAEQQRENAEEQLINQIYGAAYDMSQPLVLQTVPDNTLSAAMRVGSAALNAYGGPSAPSKPTAWRAPLQAPLGGRYTGGDGSWNNSKWTIGGTS